MYVYLVLAELVVVGLIFFVRFTLNKQEHKKIDKIIDFLNNNKTRTIQDKFEDCLEIIKQNKNKR